MYIDKIIQKGVTDKYSTSIRKRIPCDFTRKRLDYDEDEAFLSISNKPKIQNNISIHLHGDLGPLGKYEELFTCLRSVEEHDVVLIYLNSTGGYLDTALEIVQAMRDCEGEVITVITGNCHSGGSIIALGSPNLHIGPYAHMLVHNGSYGYGGKAADVMKMVTHSDKMLRKIIHEFYEGFLTASEIEQMIDGKEYWFDADEIIERLKNRKEYFEKNPEGEPELTSEIIPEAPKKPSRRKA